MSSIRVNNVSLEYSEYGNGEPLILVHGSSSDYRTWEDQIDDFGNHFRTIVYSRRYHWPNKEIPESADYVMSEHVEDLKCVLQKLNAVPAHLVGHSYGAFLCLLLAIKHPGLIKSMVLAEPPIITLFVSNTPKPLELLRLFLQHPHTAIAILQLGMKGIEPAKAAARRDDIDEVSRLMGSAVLGDKFYHQLSESRREQVRVNTIKAELLGSGFAPLKSKDLREITIPTLLVNGEESPTIFHCLSDKLEELLPRTRRVHIPEASHIMHEDNSETYNSSVISFVTNHTSH